MARLGIKIERVGFDACLASVVSIGEALNNAHVDDCIVDLRADREGMWFAGMLIARMSVSVESSCVVAIRPTPSMILFAAWLMTRLPARASLRWVDGWPHIHCSPSDDRDGHEDTPGPHSPGNLMRV